MTDQWSIPVTTVRVIGSTGSIAPPNGFAQSIDVKSSQRLSSGNYQLNFNKTLSLQEILVNIEPITGDPTGALRWTYSGAVYPQFNTINITNYQNAAVSDADFQVTMTRVHGTTASETAILPIAGTATTAAAGSSTYGQVLGAISITDIAAGGTIGSAASRVDVASHISIVQTTAAQTLTIPSPTNTIAGRLLIIANTGTASFTVSTLSNVVVGAGQSVLGEWNGTTWILLASTTGAAGGSLDDAYDLGRTITVDAGAVNLSCTNAQTALTCVVGAGTPTLGISIASGFTSSITCPGAGINSERYGSGATAVGDSSTVVGNGASSAGASGSAFGQNASAAMTSCAAFGLNSAAGTAATNDSASAFGTSCFATGAESISFGTSAVASASRSAALGRSASSTFADAWAIGRSASTTAVNQVVFGSQNSALSNIFFGQGVTATTPGTVSIFASGGSGADNAGAPLIIGAGRPTGAGTGGTITLQTAPAGASSSTLQAQVNRMFLDASGNVGFGARAINSNPATAIDVESTVTATYAANIRNSSGAAGTNTLQVQGGQNVFSAGSNLINFIRPDATQIGVIAQAATAAISYATTSDRRLKTDIKPANSGLPSVLKIKVRDFKFNGHNQVYNGLIAQELWEIYPEAVNIGGEDPKINAWSIDYGRITPLLIKAVQDQHGLIEKLESRLKALEGQR